jgi:hypothetical protein
VAYRGSHTCPDAAPHAISNSWTHQGPHAFSYAVAHASANGWTHAATFSSADLGTHECTNAIAHGNANYASADTTAHSITNPSAIVRADASANTCADFPTYRGADQVRRGVPSADADAHTVANTKPHRKTNSGADRSAYLDSNG